MADPGYVDPLVLGGRAADDGRGRSVALVGGGGRGVVGAASGLIEKKIISQMM